MTTDQHGTDCGYDWCKAHAMCTCPYSNQHPHRAVGCRYTRDDDPEQTDDE